VAAKPGTTILSVFVQPAYVSPEITHVRSLKVDTFGDCWCKIFYGPGALPVTKPKVSKHWRNKHWRTKIWRQLKIKA